MWTAGLLLVFSMTRPLHACDELVGARAAAPAGAALVPALVVATPAPASVSPAPPVPPALAQRERTRYRIDWGVLEIGQLELAIAAVAPGAVLVHADGHGVGGVLGLGHMENRIATDFDVARLESRRWDNARSGGDGDLRDRALQVGAGRVSLEREHPG